MNKNTQKLIDSIKLDKNDPYAASLELINQVDNIFDKLDDKRNRLIEKLDRLRKEYCPRNVHLSADFSRIYEELGYVIDDLKTQNILLEGQNDDLDYLEWKNKYFGND